MDSLSNMFWLDKIEITEALTIKLLNRIEDINVFLIKDKLIEIQW